MAYVADRKEASAFSNEIKKVEAEYDFAEDGGAVSVLDMIDVKKDIIVHQAYFKVKTAFTSGGSATVEVGIKGGDTDALIAATAVGSLTANAVIDGASAGQRLRIASGAVISAEIKVAALTAGKGKIVIEYADHY